MASYVERILKGARPAEIPIEQVSTYEMIINLRVARQLRIEVPQDLTVRADKVIR
jgi:putative ABC transport system substrate-binding protein